MLQKQLYLIDGNSLIYRSFFAVKLSTSKGIPTGAVYGMYNTLQKIFNKFNPEYIAVCFDVSRDTIRRKEFADYKINRKPTPQALTIQFPKVKELISSLGITILELEGYEADDIIASLTFKAVNKGWKVTIVSLDKDMFQLLDNDKVFLYNPMKDKMYNREIFQQEYHFSPENIVDFLSLTGDAIDNIPGAKGIGKITAEKLIAQFGAVENIFPNKNKLTGKVRKIIEDERENIFLSKKLLLLEKNLFLDTNIEELKLKQADKSRLYNICKELEFYSILRNLVEDNFSNEKIEILNLPSLEKTATGKKKVYFYLDSNKEAWLVFDDEDKVYRSNYQGILNILKDTKKEKVCYDLKYLLKLGYEIKGEIWDIKIGAYLLNPSERDYSLEDIANIYGQAYSSKISKERIPLILRALWKNIESKLADCQMIELMKNIEMPLIYVLADMEKQGINVNREALNDFLREIERQIQLISKAIFKEVGHEFNLNSPQQLQKVLFEEMKIPPLKRTKTGFSTNEEVLQLLSQQFPIAKSIWDYRKLNKLKSTYLSPFFNKTKDTSRLHTQFLQTGTQTGRLSSRSPNLQNIPAHGDILAKIRKIFIPSFSPGYLLGSDYSQIELRILAHFSQEKALLDSFIKNKDVHSFTAAILFNKDITLVNQAERELAKRVNFGIIYGMSHYGLARQLGISEQEAYEFIKQYFQRYPKVKEFIDKIIVFAEDKGYVETLMGRRRYLPQILSPQKDLREFARRQAVNSCIQGSAADIIKLAMVRIHNEIKKRNLQGKLILQIHDELIFDIPEKEEEVFLEMIPKLMTDSFPLSVPLTVNMKKGLNWFDMEQIKPIFNTR